MWTQQQTCGDCQGYCECSVWDSKLNWRIIGCKVGVSDSKKTLVLGADPEPKRRSFKHWDFNKNGDSKQKLRVCSNLDYPGQNPMDWNHIFLIETASHSEIALRQEMQSSHFPQPKQPQAPQPLGSWDFHHQTNGVSWGYPFIAGWFTSWNIPNKNGWWLGVPAILGNLQM
jgi:hypothetical protein